MDVWKVALGREGSADCALKLVAPSGEAKEYGIETIAWSLLGLYPDVVPPEIGAWIWKNRDEDALGDDVGGWFFGETALKKASYGN